MEGKIFSVWDDYINKQISTECLLLSTVYAPTNNIPLCYAEC